MSQNKKIINEVVNQNPGIGFTELRDKTGLSHGVLQYHIQSSGSIEQKKGAILDEDKCNNCVFNKQCRKKCIHNLLRDEQNRKILQLASKGFSQSEIAEKLGKDRSTINYHFSKFRNEDLL